MIPKKIHYCWVGEKPLSELAKKCIASWKKYCPDYEIIEWNETNYDFQKNEYMREAYKNKVWGFVPDYARLDIIYEHGGIYLDTDVEIIKSFDEILECSGFAGMEKVGQVNLGQGFGAEAHNEMIKKMRDMYEEMIFVNDKDYLATHASPVFQTKFLKERGMKDVIEIQQVDDFFIYPMEYFCPKDIDTGVETITKNTFSVHHFDGSWAEVTVRYGYHLKWECIKKYGEKIGRIVYWIKYSVYILKMCGLNKFIKKVQKKILKL